MTVQWLLCTALLVVPVLAQDGDIGPAPGRLVDIGGRKVHTVCSGSGSPTVVLEAGASSFALDWSLVQPEIARTNRVCSYDRAGHGWSEARGAVDTPARIAQDLHTVLVSAGERPPFVMVGASMGAIYVRLYQLDHPDDVVGLVLVDPVTEDRLFTRLGQETVLIGALTADELRTTLPTGPVPILVRTPQIGAPFDRLPPDLYQQRLKLDRRLIASFPPTVSAEIVLESSEAQRVALSRLLESRRRVQESLLSSRPMVVLTRSQDMTPGIADNHAGLARLSSNSRHAVVPQAGHEIHLFAPAAVIQGIQDVSAAARQGNQLSPRE